MTRTPYFKIDPRTSVPVDSISFLESSSSYTILHLQDGKQLVCSRAVGYVVEQLPHLVRVHRGFAIRADQVAKLEQLISERGKRTYRLILKSGHTIPVSYSHNSLVSVLFGNLRTSKRDEDQ